MEKEKKERQRRIQEKYFKDYVPDEKEARYFNKKGFQDPWFHWWIEVVEKEVALAVNEYRKTVEQSLEDQYEKKLRALSKNK